MAGVEERQFSTDDLIKEIKDMTYGKQFVIGKDPFYGKIIIHIQAGTRSHLEIVRTVK